MFLNSIKMAFKSLKASKMRTFLTMLGVIIGVTTVALLTTVANGATSTIIDSLSRESRLITVLTQNTSNPFTVSKLNTLVNGLRNDGSTGNFIYTAVAKNDLAIEKASFITDVKANGETYKMRVGSTVRGVDLSFTNVRNVKYDGRFPTTEKECIVDEEFIKAFLDGKTNSEVIGSEIFIGGKIEKYNYTFKSSIQEDINKFYSELYKMCKAFKIDLPETLDSSKVTYNGEVYTYSDSMNPIDYYNPTNLEVKVRDHLSKVEGYTFDENYTINISETFVGGAEYKVVGVLIEEDSSLMGAGGGMSSMSGMGASLDALAEYSKTKRGNVYVSLIDDNASLFGDFTSVDDISLNGAYLLFDSEDDIDNASVNIGLVMINLGYKLFQDCYIIPMKTVSEIMSTTMDILTVLLTVIAAISLIVGGIGIMNIMLVAVSERTREIGIRKAIGAKKSSILSQFLVEALVVSLIGGLIGLLLSFIGSLIVGAIMGLTLLMPWWVIAMSIGFCVLIGVIFGMYPAVKASRLMPIDALRHD